MNKNTKVKVRNRSTGSVGYTIPDFGNYPRLFMENEVKELPFEELQKLSYIPGGAYILQHYLVIDNIEARDEILGNVELEYNYTKEDVKHLLLNGSLNELLDCLDFAPMGVIELVKNVAVELELNDIQKREAIYKATGFNINNAISINHETDKSAASASATSVRRVVTAKPGEPIRRISVENK